MSGTEEYALPRGWCWASIEDLTAYVQRGKSPKYAERSDLPVVNQKCVRWHGVQPEHLKFIDPSQWDAWAPERSLRDGDILWNSTGTGTIGRAGIYRPLDGFARVVADSHVTIVRVKAGPPEYVHAWIRSPVIQGRIDAMQTGSTNQVELGRSEVLRTRVPVAPLNEQHRIVAKLEALQARSRRAREALDAVPPLLEKLRQSILAAAFRGDLTKDWRAKHKDVEPASELLKRIRTERRKKWEEAELAKMKAKGKTPTDDKWKAKYEVAEPTDTTNLSILPSTWCWVTVGELLEVGGLAYGVLKPGELDPSGIPMVRVMDIGDGCLAGTEIMRITPKLAEEFHRTRLQPNDVLLTVMATIGRTMVVPPHLAGANVNRAVSVLRPVVRDDLPEYLSRYFRSPGFRQTFVEKQLGTAQQRINLGDLAKFPVPLCPRAELVAILQALDERTPRAEDAARVVEAVGVALESLGRATLAKAFRGELVPQDPNDEPAEAMLARVRAATTNDSAPPGKRAARRPEPSTKRETDAR
jgi:type I restriction enzyme S subunit